MRLCLTHVSKSFGSIVTLKEVDLEIQPGEFVFICGPSGAGKSTLIKLILGQIKPTSGQIIVGDIDITKASKRQLELVRRKIGVIFQDYQLIPDQTIEENIVLSLDIVSFPESEIASRVNEVLKKVGLLNRRHLFPSQLSGGELQRAALARALSIQPEIILADEPTGNLDVDNSWNLLKLLKDINRQNGTTVVITTHDQGIIETLGRRTIYIKNGHLSDNL